MNILRPVFFASFGAGMGWGAGHLFEHTIAEFHLFAIVGGISFGATLGLGIALVGGGALISRMEHRQKMALFDKVKGRVDYNRVGDTVSITIGPEIKGGN